VPLADPTVATETLPLVQVPPDVLERTIESPAHTGELPAMTEGSGLTVTSFVTTHPDGAT